VLITDHNVRETLGICDRAYIISEGRVLAEGTPEQIVENPTCARSTSASTSECGMKPSLQVRFRSTWR
jgi:ABC-type lipopolysaccharide export system ATPase subunit